MIGPGRAGSIRVGLKGLTHQRLRLALSVAAVGLALLLIVSLDAIYRGILNDVTAYPDNAGAPVIVSQRGVQTMHMSSSALPRGLVGRLRADRRVRRAEPILYASVVLQARAQPDFTYLIGYRGGGGPWRPVRGKARPRGDEIVIDSVLARRLGVARGATLRVAGRSMRVVGLTSGTASVISAVSFVDYAAFESATRARAGTASYALVWPTRGVSPQRLAAAIERDYPVTAQTRERFSAAERDVVDDMSTELIAGLAAIGFVVGIAVAGVAMYSATTARLREYALLKAIGMRNRALYALVARQALVTAAAGLGLALGLVAALGAVVPLADEVVKLEVTVQTAAKAIVATLAMTLGAALLPAWRIGRLDPASVYRR